MNILFIGTTGIHHTLIAAHLYLNQLNEQDYSDLELWADWDKEALGLPLFLDYDDRGNKVYVLGVGCEVLMAQKTIEQLDKLLNRGSNDIIIKPVFIKREKVLLLLHRWGRNKKSNQLVRMLITYLLKKEFFTIQKQVERFRERVRFV